MRDDIVWLWNTTELSSGQIARRFGISRYAVLGVVRRDKRARRRKETMRMAA